MDEGGIHRRSIVENTNFALFVFIAVEGKGMAKGISLHTNPRFAEGPGVAGTFHEDSNLLQAQP